MSATFHEIRGFLEKVLKVLQIVLLFCVPKVSGSKGFQSPQKELRGFNKFLGIFRIKQVLQLDGREELGGSQCGSSTSGKLFRARSFSKSHLCVCTQSSAVLCYIKTDAQQLKLEFH